MIEQPPHFRYHPRAYERDVGVMDAIDLECECCGQVRGWISNSRPYCIADVENVCPWCIADGSAHKKWDASFSLDIDDGSSPDPHHPQTSSVAPAAIDEMMHRTPGYFSWQGEYWKTHCNDVCEFHGDISQDELASLSPDSEALFRSENGWLIEPSTSLHVFAHEHYHPKGHLGIYKFVCRHCGIVRLHVDMS